MIVLNDSIGEGLRCLLFRVADEAVFKRSEYSAWDVAIIHLFSETRLEESTCEELSSLDGHRSQFKSSFNHITNSIDILNRSLLIFITDELLTSGQLDS